MVIYLIKRINIKYIFKYMYKRKTLVDENLLSLNENAIFKEIILDHNIKIICIDNFFKNIDKVKEIEKNIVDSLWGNSHYPGHKKYIKFVNKQNLENNVFRALKPYFNKVTWDCFFGKVTSKEKYLNPWQKQPHLDGNMIALLVYLNEPNNCYGGTAFYKHIQTGKIKSNLKDASKILLRGFYNNKYTNYMSDSNKTWELVKMIPMKKNRAIIYSGLIFHSGYIKNLSDFNEEGRKTLNIFLN